MVASQRFYMCTINQDPECEVKFLELYDTILKYLKNISNRYVLSTEEGSLNGKKHLHFSMELKKDVRRDNLKNSIYRITKIKKGKYVMYLKGTSKCPHEETWLQHATSYCVKDGEYETNIEKELLEKIIKEKELIDKVEQQSIFITKPEFYKMYRKEIKIYKQETPQKHYNVDNMENDIYEKIFMNYTPLWLKSDIIIKIIEYQEMILMYEEIEELLKLHLNNKNPPPVQYENVTNTKRLR